MRWDFGRGKTPLRMPSRNKFGAVKTHAGGVLFDSKAEARRYQELMLLEKAGEIKKLARQVAYDLKVNGILIATYKADFVYWEKNQAAHQGDPTTWREITEDVKGHRTAVYIMKKKLMRACLGISIREVQA